jgi:hypothetical protein
MNGGTFNGARFVLSYSQVMNGTKLDLEGDFPAIHGMSEPDQLKMINDFFTIIFTEDIATLKARSKAYAV